MGICTAMAPGGIIFDCDGTLIDSGTAWLETQDALFRQVGAHPTDDDIAVIVSSTIPEVGDYLHAKFGIGPSGAAVVGMIDELMIGYYRRHARPRPGALEFAESMFRRGVRLTVASSSPQAYLQAGLRCAGFLPYLDGVVSVDDVGASKRSPAVYDKARDIMGTPVSDTWGFEDSVYALRTLARAGYRTVGVYDHDGSGSWNDMRAVADVAVLSFADLDLTAFPPRIGSARKETC